MATEVTRQLSASAYLNPRLPDRIIQFVKNPYNAIIQPPGIDASLLLKHALNANQRARSFYWLILVPSLAMFVAAVVFPPVAFIAYLFILVCVIVKAGADKRFIREQLSPTAFGDSFDYRGPGQDDLRRLEKNTTRNVVYYSGYSPFVGCGFEIGGWSFVIDIDKGKTVGGQTATPKPFLEDELYYVVSKDLLTLKVDHLTIENKVYFNGKKIRDQKDLLPDILGHPATDVSSEMVKKAMNSGIDGARFYKMIQVVGWDGDLILTSFFRVQKGEKTLFVENNYYLLPPIKEEYKVIDKIKEESGLGHFLKLFLGWLLGALLLALLSIAKAYAAIMKGIMGLFGVTPEAALKKTVRISPDYDYGAHTSIREVVSQDKYLQHFQKLDKERYFKTIDKRIFNALADFLDSKDISTMEFKEREAAVLNNGIIIQGNVSGGNMTTGMGAAITNVLKQAKQSKTSN